MPWPAAIFLGLIVGVLGGFQAGLVADLAVPWLRIRNSEGTAAFFVVGMALIGFLGGTAIGIATCRLAGAPGPGGAMRGFGAAVLLVAGIIGAAGALAWSQREREPHVAGQPLDLAVELRLPAGLPRPVPHRDGASYVDLQSGRSFGAGMLRLAEAREEAGHWILPATVPIRGAAPDRVLSLRQPGRETRYFATAIAARPDRLDAAWSGWIEPQAGAPASEPRPALRYRIVAREAVSPEDRRRSALAALPRDAPAEALRPFLSALWQDVARQEAVNRLLARGDAEAQLVAWMNDADPELARDAMLLAATLQPGSPAYAAAVRGRAAEVARIAAAIEPGTDSARLLYDRCLVLASGVIGAAPGLWQSRADLRPELRAMAEAVRPRETAVPRALGDAIDAAIAQIDALAR